MKKKILIIYHSQTGNTEKIAEACFEGIIKNAEVEVRLKKAFVTSLKDIELADGFIIVSPEYFGYMAGAIKDFFDRTYYPARNKNINKPYALIICCENDGEGTKRSIESIANGYILKKTLDTLIVKEKEILQKMNAIKEIGETFSAGIALGIF